MKYIDAPVSNSDYDVVAVSGVEVIDTSKIKRRETFHNKAAIGNRRNNACIAVEKDLLKRIEKGLTAHEAITLAWSAGCDYGKEHAEELKL